MVDPNIILQSRPQINPEGPLESYGKVLAIKGAMQHGQLQSEQLKHTQMANQQSERDLKDQEAVQRILGETGGDIGKALPALSRTVSPKTFMALDKAHRESMKTAAEMESSRLPVLKDQSDRLFSITDQALKMQPEEFAQQWPAIRAAALSVNPQLQIPEQPVPQEQLRGFQLAFGVQKNYIDREVEKRAAVEEARKAQEFAVTLPGKQANSNLQVATAAGQVPIQPAQQAQIDASKAQTEQTAKYQNARLGLERQRVSLEGRRVAMQAGGVGGKASGNTATGEDFLKTVSPGVASELKAMAEGRLTAPSPNSRAAGAQQKRSMLMQYDPQFSEQRAQVRKAFTTGTDGKNIGALNTAMVHLGRLGDVAEALNNGSFTPGNEAFNYLRDKFGSKAVTNFELLKDAVAGEMASSLKGTATDIEIGNMKKSIRASNSPAQMRGVVTEGMGILKDKANTFEERYKAQMPNDTWSPILPSAKQSMEKYGVGKSEGKGGGVVVTDPRGKAHNFPNQAAADAFKKAAGIK